MRRAGSNLTSDRPECDAVSQSYHASCLHPTPNVCDRLVFTLESKLKRISWSESPKRIGSFPEGLVDPLESEEMIQSYVFFWSTNLQIPPQAILDIIPSVCMLVFRAWAGKRGL